MVYTCPENRNLVKHASMKGQATCNSYYVVIMHVQ